ncbi:hypothetical protein BD779DRAFT_1677395 [Infundibulicybe gibba]|nr:hypothetical protein BD779DRAFT_1677395 [Infundibulicybe gibba]
MRIRKGYLTPVSPVTTDLQSVGAMTCGPTPLLLVELITTSIWKGNPMERHGHRDPQARCTRAMITTYTTARRPSIPHFLWMVATVDAKQHLRDVCSEIAVEYGYSSSFFLNSPASDSHGSTPMSHFDEREDSFALQAKEMASVKFFSRQSPPSPLSPHDSPSSPPLSSHDQRWHGPLESFSNYAHHQTPQAPVPTWVILSAPSGLATAPCATGSSRAIFSRPRACRGRTQRSRFASIPAGHFESSSLLGTAHFMLPPHRHRQFGVYHVEEQ